jgi:hypothetical protein
VLCAIFCVLRAVCCVLRAACCMRCAVCSVFDRSSLYAVVCSVCCVRCAVHCGRCVLFGLLRCAGVPVLRAYTSLHPHTHTHTQPWAYIPLILVTKGWTAVIASAAMGQVGTLRMLIDAGADLEKTDKNVEYAVCCKLCARAMIETGKHTAHIVHYGKHRCRPGRS